MAPLQMAMVAAAVANGGKLMAPHLTDRVVDQTGRTMETITPTVYSQVMKPSTAAEVTKMMENVVEEGTGTAVQLGAHQRRGQDGHRVDRARWRQRDAAVVRRVRARPGPEGRDCRHDREVAGRLRRYRRGADREGGDADAAIGRGVTDG